MAAEVPEIVGGVAECHMDLPPNQRTVRIASEGPAPPMTKVLPPTGESVPFAITSEGVVSGYAKQPVFYLICYELKGETHVFEQSIDPMTNSFESVLKLLMDGSWPIPPTAVMWCHSDGCADLSHAFAEVWWNRIKDTFHLGSDRLPGFIERHLDEVATRHWALMPQGKGTH